MTVNDYDKKLVIADLTRMLTISLDQTIEHPSMKDKLPTMQMYLATRTLVSVMFPDNSDDILTYCFLMISARHPKIAGHMLEEWVMNGADKLCLPLVEAIAEVYESRIQ